MIHQWFMHFGGIAILIAAVAFFGTRRLANPRRQSGSSSDNKQGAAVAACIFGLIGCLILVAALFCVFFGVSGTIPGWIGVGLLAGAGGLGSAATSD
ncbi:MAG TPA: hypothetical protein V6C81_11020 [Planktothrix sp.]|jgi:hypothetical protein